MRDDLLKQLSRNNGNLALHLANEYVAEGKPELAEIMWQQANNPNSVFSWTFW